MAATRTVTIVFTDLVGSTALSSSLAPDVADQLRETHLALLREAVQAHGGTEVKSLGDGLMVVFPISSGALNCAEAMQQAINRYNLTAPNALSVRIGLSHGEANERDGDFFGDAVVEAARLCAAAEGGQVLASQLVQLTAGRRATQQFVPIGDLELKGLSEPVATVEMQWSRESTGDEQVRIPLPQRCSVVPVAGFIGRSTEQSTLTAALKVVTTEGHAQVVLIGGEPGMGKTTLATEAARAAWDAGATVLFGRSDEDLSIPYGAWAEAIKHLVGYAPTGLLESLSSHAGSLVKLAPTLASVFGTSYADAFGDAESARYMLYNAVTATLRAASESVPIIVVLDDLQWADAQSLQLLRHVLSSSDPVRTLIIGTFRESEVSVGTPLADLLGALHREQGVERISLRGLGDAELLELMESAAGQELDDDGIALRNALLAETDGNPFFAGELLRHLVECGAIYQSDGRWVASDDLRTQGLPVSVREVVGHRVSRLGDEGMTVLSIASVIGRDFDLGLLAAASDTREDQLLDLMDTAVEATLIENVGGTLYTFVHALIEHTLYDSLTPARRARLHRTVAECIETQVRGRTQGHTAALAYHWSQATTPEDYDKALHYTCVAGAEALARLAPSEALRSYTQALAMIDERGGSADPRRYQILVGVGDAQRQTGTPGYRETLLEAGRLARESGDVDSLVAAALANTRGLISRTGTVDLERIEILEAANAALGSEHSERRARVLMILATELSPVAGGTDLERAKAIGLEAVAMARSLGPPTLAEALQRFCTCFNTARDHAQNVSKSKEAVDLVPQLENLSLKIFCLDQWAITLIISGRVHEARSIYDQATPYVGELNQPGLLWLHAWLGAALKVRSGDFRDAELEAVQAFEMGAAIGEPDAFEIYAAQIGAIRLGQGRGAELVELVEQVTRDVSLAGYRGLLAALYCDLDRTADARLVIEPYVSTGFATILPDPIWATMLSLCAYVAWHVRWVEAAEVLLDELRPFTDMLLFIGAAGWGCVPTYAAMAAVVLDQRETANELFATAAELLTRNDLKWGLALNQYAWGKSLIEWGETDNRDRAIELLRFSLGSSTENGYELIEKRARAVLESMGEAR
jgi:class 3 adenylate cyclase